MPARPCKQRGRAGFTLIELLVVLAIISVLGCLLLPAMAKTRIRTTGAGCLNNLKQMMVGWSMYKDDNNDVLLSNGPGGAVGWNGYGVEDWFNANVNTNPIPYLNGFLAPYVNNHIELYRCPGDVIPSANGQRIRSYSMNSQMGTTQGGTYNPGWRFYLKGSDLTCPAPQSAWIFAEESMYSLNDGLLQMNLNAPDYPDVPGSYHDGACGISFADGHVELHKWMWVKLPSYGLPNVPYIYGVINNGAHWPSAAQDVDWVWLRARSACKNGQQSVN